MFLCTPQAFVSPRTELRECLKFFPPGVAFSQEAKGRYWLSPRKRKVVPPGTPPLLPGSNMAGHPEPFQNTPRTPAFRGPFPPSVHLAPPGSLPQGSGQRTRWARPSARATPTGPLQPIGGRAAPIGSARLPRPQPRCGPRLPGRPVAPLSVVRARGGRSPRRDPSRTLAAGRTAHRRHDQPAPRRSAWTSRTVSGRAGGRAGRAGLRRGSVYRLKMAVCVALFCGPRARAMAGPGRTLLGREPHAGPRPTWRGGRPLSPPPLPTGRPRCELRGLRAPSSGAPRAARNLPALRGGAARARGGSERVAGGAEPRHGRAASGSCDASQGETSIKRSIGVGSDLPPSRNPRVVTK